MLRSSYIIHTYFSGLQISPYGRDDLLL